MYIKKFKEEFKMKENKQTLKNELNEEEQSKVSGGYRIYHSKGDFKDPDGIYNIYCDFCGKKFEGKGVFEVEGGLHGCVDC